MSFFRSSLFRDAAAPRWLIFACLCQAATIWITNELWTAREAPPYLPLCQLPNWLTPGPLAQLWSIDYHWIILASLLTVLWRPRIGMPVHAGVFVWGCVLDAFRIQVMFVAIGVLMASCVWKTGRRWARWYLAAMWFWAGLHKALSPDWFGPVTWHQLERSWVPTELLYPYYAPAIAGSEILLGLAVVLWPRPSRLGCWALHCGIILFATPVLQTWNYSILPWNIAMLTIGGCWVLGRAESGARIGPANWQEWLAACFVFLYPAGYYVGWSDSNLVNLLFSGNLPKAQIVHTHQTERPNGFQNLQISFPDAHGRFVQYFAQVGNPGEKLHVDDPRWAVADSYWWMRPDYTVEQISRQRFLQARPGEVEGVERDNPNAVFQLERAGVKLERDPFGVVRVTLGPTHGDRELQLAVGFSVLNELQAKGAQLTDNSLTQLLTSAHRLSVLDVSNTKLTGSGFPDLSSPESESANQPRAQLKELRAIDTPIHDLRFTQQTPELEWLILSGSAINDTSLSQLGELPQLSWLDLSHTAITDNGLTTLTRLPNLSILILSDTSLTEAAAATFAAFPNLRLVQVANTGLTATAIQQHAPNLRVKD